MNKTQLEYAVKRLNEVYLDKVNPIKVAMTKQTAFTGKVLLKAIKQGKVRLKSKYADKPINHWTDIGEVFDGIPDEEKFDRVGFEQATRKITAEHNRIRDLLYLGDAKEALALIDTFAATKY